MMIDNWQLYSQYFGLGLSTGFSVGICALGVRFAIRQFLQIKNAAVVAWK